MTSTLLVYKIDRLVLPNEDGRKLPSIKPHTESYFLSESSYNEISVEEDSLLQGN